MKTHHEDCSFCLFLARVRMFIAQVYVILFVKCVGVPLLNRIIIYRILNAQTHTDTDTQYHDLYQPTLSDMQNDSMWNFPLAIDFNRVSAAAYTSLHRAHTIALIEFICFEFVFISQTIITYFNCQCAKKELQWFFEHRERWYIYVVTILSAHEHIPTTHESHTKTFPPQRFHRWTMWPKNVLHRTKYRQWWAARFVNKLIKYVCTLHFAL